MNKCDSLVKYSTQELNDITFEKVLESTFYKNWRNNNCWDGSLEIIFSPKCNQGCSYCYVNKNNREIFSCQDFLEDKSIENTKLILNWLNKENMCPAHVDIFSGELFAQEAGYRLLQTIIDFYKNNPNAKRPELFMVPTNGTFVVNDTLVARVKKYIKDFEDIGSRLALSFSVDGLYASKITRKYKKNLDYDLSSSMKDDFFDKVFKFMEETNNLPHPMISPENIHVWKKNFLWYENMMEKYHINFNLLYLLEVRNYNWTKEKLKLYEEFIIFILEHMREKINNDEKFLYWLTDRENDDHCMGFNFISSMLNSGDPMPTCMLGRQLMVRASDLKLFPCHRLSYPELEIGEYIPDEEKGLKFKVKNPELGISILSFNPKKQNICNTCIIKNLCANQCFGSCYETVGDMFTPIPSVCNMYFLKTLTVLKTLDKMSLLNGFLSLIRNKTIKNSIIYLLDKEKIGELK